MLVILLKNDEKSTKKIKIHKLNTETCQNWYNFCVTYGHKSPCLILGMWNQRVTMLHRLIIFCYKYPTENFK